MRSSHAAGVIAILLGAAFAACAGDAGTTATRPEVVDSAGVRLVRNGAVGRWGSAVPAVTEVLRIGVTEGDEPYQLHRVAAVAVDDAGRVLIANGATATIRVFDPAGTFIREFGGRGRGPGEFTSIDRLLSFGDSVLVVDGNLRRATLFGPDGSHVRTSSGRPRSGWQVMIMAAGTGGWVAGVDSAAEPPPLRPGERWRIRAAFHRYHPEQDSVGAPIAEYPPMFMYGVSGVHVMELPLFQPSYEFGFDAAGSLYLSRAAPYRVDVYDIDGRHVRGVARAHEPRPITNADVEEVKRLVRSHFDTIAPTADRNPRAEMQRLLDRVDVQASLPLPPAAAVLGRMVVAPEGAFWVERVDGDPPARREFRRLLLGQPRTAPTRWDAFDAEGAFLGTVELPARFTPHVLRGLDVTGVLRDELDVELVVSYLVTPAR